MVFISKLGMPNRKALNMSHLLFYLISEGTCTQKKFFTSNTVVWLSGAVYSLRCLAMYASGNIWCLERRRSGNCWDYIRHTFGVQGPNHAFYDYFLE